MVRRGISFTFAVVLALLLIGSAEAHATLVRSEPPAGALLTTAPKELVLEFSERLDPSFSAVRLLDSKSQAVNAGPGVIDPAAPRVLRLPLAALPKDSYTAVWKVRSADDGHVTEGSLPFGVGVAVTATALIPPLGAPDPATLPPPPLDSATRWLNLLMAAVTLGGLPFALLVWRPAWRAAQRAGADCQASDEAMTQTLRRLLLVAGALFLLTNLLFLVAQAATAAGVPLAQAVGAPVLQLLGGRSGMLWLARVALTLLIGAIAFRLPPAGRGTAWPWWVALLLGGAALLTISLSSHGAAVPNATALAVALDWLHLAAMVAWLGGLVPLAIALRAAQRDAAGAFPLATLIPRFSRLAASCIVILALTGVYNYLIHVNELDLLAATTYGRGLLVKLGLFSILLLLGGLNLFILSRRLRVSGNRLARAFGRSVRGELVAGALLLLAVGVMTSVAPSNTAWEEHERQGIAQSATVGDVDLTLRIAPAQIGDNEIAVDVADRRPGAQAAASKVLLRFNMLGHPMAPLQTEARSSSTQRYSTRGNFLSMGGRWNVEVVLRRAGFDDVTHTFQVDILRSAADASFTAPAATALPTPTVAATAQAQPTAAVAQVQNAAPDTPIPSDTWAPGNKQAVGTAFTYDGPAGDANPSRVWFGITGGAITEGLYPDVSTANVKSLSLLVTDGKTFVADEMQDATLTIERLDKRTPAFRVTSTDKAGRWTAVKEIIADPKANTILFTVSFQALKGAPNDYRLYLIYTPRVGNDGDGDLSQVRDGIAEAWDERAGIYTALAAAPAPALLTTGYTRKNDLVTDLRDFRVDTVYQATTIPGRLTIGAQLPTSGVSTVALGFGRNHDAARAAAMASLTRGFAAVAQDYMRGWARYLDTLTNPYPNLPLYNESAAVLKTLEDKTHYGAGVASIAVPWGQWHDDTNANERGYRYVRPQDLAHVAMAMLVLGDTHGARDTLAYFDEVAQQPDGSFPQQAMLDGRVVQSSVSALDLAASADPILLAWQLKAADRYASLVKPAADFIVAHGPGPAEDRWEEQVGYTPATLAHEIAGLVCAADLATQAGDTVSAKQYLRTADAWNGQIERWVLTTTGPLGKGTYYLRVTDGNPNAATKVMLADGGGTYDQRAIVDLSFLDLVRLGVRRPDDPNILATLEVAESALEVKTPQGERYYRSTHDGYGERTPGAAPDGHGQLWPLLIGEWSIYQVARTHSESPASWYMSEMWATANQGGMLPEQVFPDGSGTGAATPLARAHAEFVLFINAIKQAAVPDMPAVVAKRYLH